MGTITPRKRRDGSTGYTAQIRISKKGKGVYQESQTFERRAAAQAWIKKRETELAEPGALDRAHRSGDSIKDLIDRYLEEHGKIRPMGKTKTATLLAIGRSWLGSLTDRELNSQRVVEYAMRRIEEDGIKPQTVGNDLAHLGAVVSVARPAWGYDIDASIIQDARKVLKKMGAVSKSRERSRRPTRIELEALIDFYEEKWARRQQQIDMTRVILFGLFSTRRQDEITRIRWDGIDEERRAVLITDMKNPGQKWGNDVWCHVPDPAWEIMMSMPRVSYGPFPYEGRSISASFTRACHFLQLEDLRFHDLRHDGVSRLFEIGWDIPRVASVSGHRDWNSMRRYTHLRGQGDPYDGWDRPTKVMESRAQYVPLATHAPG